MSRSREEQIYLLSTKTPNSFATMQKLVMALAAVHKSKGKRPWFGRSPEVKANAKLDKVMSELLISLRLDGIVSQESPDEEVLEMLVGYIDAFSVPFPSWPDAYQAAEELLKSNHQAAIEYVRRRR